MHYKTIRYIHAHTLFIFLPALPKKTWSSSVQALHAVYREAGGLLLQFWQSCSAILVKGSAQSDGEGQEPLHLLERQALEPFSLKDSSCLHFSQEEKRPWARNIFTELWVGFMPPSGHKLKMALTRYQFLGDSFVSFRGPSVGR